MRHFGPTLVTLAFGSLLGSGIVRADTSKQDRVQVSVLRLMVFPNALLKGDYVIVHDDDKAEKGEPCLFIYRVRLGKPDQLVSSVHCTRVKRDRATEFKVVTERLTEGLQTIREIQFAGSTVGHQPFHTR